MNPIGSTQLRVLAHRGLWTSAGEQNSLKAFSAAWSAGVGVETDLRDLDGEIVVSHDMPRSDSSPMTLSELLSEWHRHGRTGELALNIKSDGIARHVDAAVGTADGSASVFVFDMSVPDQLTYSSTNLRTFSRWSEIEHPPTAGRPDGLWLDAFWDDGWWEAAAVRSYLRQGTAITLVSPELHGRPFLPVWERLEAEGLDGVSGMSLCTDHVDEALEFFGIDANTEIEVRA